MQTNTLPVKISWNISFNWRTEDTEGKYTLHSLKLTSDKKNIKYV